MYKSFRQLEHFWIIYIFRQFTTFLNNKTLALSFFYSGDINVGCNLVQSLIKSLT